MTRPPYLASLDAGNTKTIAAVADSNGRVLGCARGGSGNIYAGLSNTVRLLGNVYREALAKARLTPGDIAHLSLSATGADWAEDFADLQGAALREGLVSGEKNLTVVNDAVGALWAGSATGEGVVIAAGTSAGTAARRGRRVWHSSYWQQTEGAVELGQKGLRAVYLAELGIAPATRLTAAFLERLELDSVEAVLHAFTARTSTLHDAHAGELARVLLDEAEGGDEVASHLARAHGAALGEYALVAAHKVGFADAFPLVLIGGLMRHSGSVLKASLLNRVCTEAPNIRVQEDDLEPVGGALCVALEQLGRYTPEARALIRDTLPPASFFAT